MATSYNDRSSLTCPQCGQQFEGEVWTVLDAQERPDLVEALRTGQLNLVTCPHCGTSGPAGAPLLFHDATTRRVVFAAPPGAAEYELREMARDLHTILISTIPEEQYRAYLTDVQITEGLDGMRLILEKEARRRRGTGDRGQVAKPVRLPEPAPAALPAAPREEELPPLLLGVQELLSADGDAQVEQALAAYPELLAPDADAALAQLAEIAVQEREHDVAEALTEARKLLGRLRASGAPQAQAVAEPQNGVVHSAPAPPLTRSPAHASLAETIYLALMQAGSEQELIEATRAHPALLDPWVDAELVERIDAALDLGDERTAQQIEDRREALAELRGALTSDGALVEAVRTLLAADDQDDLAAVLDANPVLLSDAAQDMLWQLSSEARARGDERVAVLAVEYRALLREVRKGLDEG